MRSRHIVSLLLAVSAAACGGNNSNPTTSAVTFWQDVAPIYNNKCVRCHQAGGIGPFRLDNYADAKAKAALELTRITEGTMPPYHMVHDGSCGSFQDDVTLSAEEKATITTWITGDQAEGTSVALTLPARPKLDGALEMKTPGFSPVAQGTALALNDEYRCFLMDPPNTADAFLTGYVVTPGDATIVHHVLGFVVDPARTDRTGRTNAEIIKALDDQSPDRLGWPCFGAAGEGVSVSAVPVGWAPGQGVVYFPDGMGLPIRTTDKIVVQVHYNLADPAAAGRTDSTTVQLRFADHVTRRLSFALPDPFLDSLSNTDANNDPAPDTLPPGVPDAKYTWTLTGRQLGLGSVASADLVAVMPHMHGRGVRQQLRLGPADNLTCASHIEHWDFHWQQFYFYKTSPAITPTTTVQVTCEYDTTRDTRPVLPGWGTRNEMCTIALMMALPPM